jgi:hypothetical protein
MVVFGLNKFWSRFDFLLNFKFKPGPHVSLLSSLSVVRPPLQRSSSAAFCYCHCLLPLHAAATCRTSPAAPIRVRTRHSITSATIALKSDARHLPPHCTSVNHPCRHLLSALLAAVLPLPMRMCTRQPGVGKTRLTHHTALFYPMFSTPSSFPYSPWPPHPSSTDKPPCRPFAPIKP